MKKKMILITFFLFVGFAILLPIFILSKNAIIEALTITAGIAFYHFFMRLAVGYVVNLIMNNEADCKNAWFSEKSFERKFYKLLRVQKWKKYVPTYNPETFDINRKTVKKIIGATCQAEVVHEIIMACSLLPIILIPILGGAVVIIITSVLSALIDLVFVILQRYNRPRLLKAIGDFDDLEQTIKING